MKDFVYQCFHDPFDIKSRIVNGVFSFLIIFSIAILPLHFLPPEYSFIEPKLEFVDKITITLFLAEYILRIWSDKNAWKFIFSWEGLIDLVVILPFFLEKFNILDSVGIFIVLRIFRIFKFINIFHFEQEALSDTDQKSHNELYILENEKIKKVIFRHPIIFLVNLLLPIFLMSMALFIFIAFGEGIGSIVLGVLLFLLSILFFIKSWLDFHYDSLFVTNYRVILQNHQLFGATVNALRYESIVNIIPDNRGLLEWVFGFGKIEIETASEQRTQSFFNIKDPHKVAQYIEIYRQKSYEDSDMKNRDKRSSY